MIGNKSLSQFPYPAAASVAPASDADFNTRWTAWVSRGRVHEQRARRRFVVWASVLAMGAAIAFAFFRS